MIIFFKNSKGFTLIEMLFVLLIISVLIILVVPNLSGKSEDISDKGCQALSSVVQAQVDSFHIDIGRYPSGFEELIQYDYITSEQKKCPNNKLLNYNKKTGKITIPSGNE